MLPLSLSISSPVKSSLQELLSNFHFCISQQKLSTHLSCLAQAFSLVSIYYDKLCYTYCFIFKQFLKCCLNFVTCDIILYLLYLNLLPYILVFSTLISLSLRSLVLCSISLLTNLLLITYHTFSFHIFFLHFLYLFSFNHVASFEYLLS